MGIDIKEKVFLDASPESINKGVRASENRLRDLGLCSLEKRKPWGDLIMVFQYLKEAYRKDGEGVLIREFWDRIKGNVFKLKEGRISLDVRKKLFTVRVVRQWNMLPRKFVCAPPLEAVKDRLDGALSNLI